jgi:diguanylate cyclase (GGDEF)-like protein
MVLHIRQPFGVKETCFLMKSEAHSESLLAKVSQQLAALEKRDWELWLILSGTGILVGAGLLALLFPAAILKQGNVRMEIEVSRESFLGLVTLLILFNTYIIGRRMELRRTREAVISTAMQSELTRLQSFTDPLTEVYNRRSLDDMANGFIIRAKRLGNPLTFIVIDADRFRDVNSRYGHLTGDFVLAEIAGLLKGAVRGSDAVVRYGGDEFLIILADAPLKGAQVVTARIAKFAQDWNSAGHLPGFKLVLSIGLAEWSAEKTLDQILHEADQNMYSSKEVGKNRATGA